MKDHIGNKMNLHIENEEDIINTSEDGDEDEDENEEDFKEDN